MTLDLQRREVSVGSSRVALSTREFELLAYMMRHAGEPCSREQLLSDVWGCGFDTGTNVVDVYVRRLRSKLGTQAIDTLRNVGYCLEAA